MILIGLDDTDSLGTPGTGYHARQIAAELASDHRLLGVTRHQLLEDARVPCTKNNSSAAIALSLNGQVNLEFLLERVAEMLAASYQPGSDPGLCVACDVPAKVIAFGRRVQRRLVTQREARTLASECRIPLVGLGGDEGGVIGALAAVGLAASQEDGRYVLVGRARELYGLQPVSALLAAGIAAVQTSGGEPVNQGLVQADRLRPARRGGRPVAVVEWKNGYWRPLKLN
jgi:tRNA(Ile2) C34 agmatinyltransferase TiaS